MTFEQVNGTMGGLPASHLAEPVHLRVADHEETIQFAVTPKHGRGYDIRVILVN